MSWRARLRRPHYVYRCYDAAGSLLYVGLSVDVDARIAAHLSPSQPGASAFLRRHMVRHEVSGPFHGLFAGERAERLAIQTEHPVFNKDHSGKPRRAVDAEIADYLEAAS